MREYSGPCPSGLQVKKRRTAISFARTGALFLLMAFLLNVTIALGKVPEADSPEAMHWYIYLTGDAVATYSSEEDLSLYDGVSFPHYYGYIMYDDEGLTFKKKTSLPFPLITKPLEDILKNGYVMTRENIHLRHLIKPVYPGQPGWTMAILDEVVNLPGLHWIAFNGPPDENYEPVFTDTCIFDHEKKQFCETSTMKGYIFTRLIPTSNTVRERRIRKGDLYEFYVERYNDQTGQWEYSHEYKLGDGIVHSWR